MHRPHQRRTLSIAQSIELHHELQAEKAVPQASRVIDGVLPLDQASSGWGVVRAPLSHRLVIIEHFSRPPGIPKVATARAKLAWMVEQWWLGREDHGRRPPLLLVLSSGRPREALERMPELAPGRVSGIWATMPSGLGDVLLVDVKGIERMAGTSVLRLMHASASPVERRQRVRDVLTDQTIEDRIRGKLLEDIMRGTVELSADEREVTYDSILERGRDEGRAQEAARAVLAVFEVREMTVTDEVRARIEACDDPDLLEVWLKRAIKAESPEMIFSE